MVNVSKTVALRKTVRPPCINRQPFARREVPLRIDLPVFKVKGHHPRPAWSRRLGHIAANAQPRIARRRLRPHVEPQIRQGIMPTQAARQKGQRKCKITCSETRRRQYRLSLPLANRRTRRYPILSQCSQQRRKFIAIAAILAKQPALMPTRPFLLTTEIRHVWIFSWGRIPRRCVPSICCWNCQVNAKTSRLQRRAAAKAKPFRQRFGAEARSGVHPEEKKSKIAEVRRTSNRCKQVCSGLSMRMQADAHCVVRSLDCCSRSIPSSRPAAPGRRRPPR